MTEESWLEETRIQEGFLISSIIYCINFYFKEQGVDISKLALHFTMEMEDFPTTLVSTASIQNLQKNIDAVNAKLTDKEGNCLQFIRNKYVCWVFWALNNLSFSFFFFITCTIIPLIIAFLSSIFKPSGNLSWEGVEVAKYWEKMKAL